MKRLIFSILAFAFVSVAAQAGTELYKNGDIIFHESQSAQSKAIQEVTQSRWSHVGILFKGSDQWMVAEAVQPVHVTTLAAFIARGKNGDFRVYRLPGLTEAQTAKLRVEAVKYMGKSYDSYFEWSDDLIYCSEFVYKVFLAATGREIGTVQHFRDLKMDGPYAKALIRLRITDRGRELNLDEPIVTPASQTQDPHLVLVEKHEQ